MLQTNLQNNTERGKFPRHQADLETSNYQDVARCEDRGAGKISFRFSSLLERRVQGPNVQVSGQFSPSPNNLKLLATSMDELVFPPPPLLT